MQKVRQILLNLLTNALRFTASGEVRVRAGGDGGEEIRVEVQDSGVGIHPAHHDRIFEPFTQVDQSMTREAHGTGLGLSIARRHARLLGGDLSVASELGTGSTFTLTLPKQHPVETGETAHRKIA